MNLYKKAIELFPEFAAAFCNLGTCLKIEGKFEESMFYNRLAIQIDPMLADAYTNIANIYKDMGQIDLSLPFYFHALKIDSNSSIACSNIAVLKWIIVIILECIQRFK